MQYGLHRCYWRRQQVFSHTSDSELLTAVGLPLITLSGNRGPQAFMSSRQNTSAVSTEGFGNFWLPSSQKTFQVLKHSILSNYTAWADPGALLAYDSQHTPKGSPREFWELTQVKNWWQFLVVCREPPFFTNPRGFIGMKQVCLYWRGSAGPADYVAVLPGRCWALDATSPGAVRQSYLNPACAMNALPHFLWGTNAEVWDTLWFYCPVLPSPDISESLTVCLSNSFYVTFWHQQKCVYRISPFLWH